MNKHLLDNVRFYFAQSVFMNSCHYKAYDRLEKRKQLVSKIVIGFSIVTIVLLILQIVALETEWTGLLSIVAYVGLILTGSTLIFELINKEDLTVLMFEQRVSAEKYKSIRDQYMSLISDIISEAINEEEARSKRDKLLKKYNRIGKSSPATTYEDYKEAQSGLGLKGNSEEEFTWSDKEIDLFLPKGLRKTT